MISYVILEQNLALAKYSEGSSKKFMIKDHTLLFF